MASPTYIRLGRALALSALPVAAACTGSIGTNPAANRDPIEPPVPAFAAAPGALRRITAAEYQNTIREIVGDEIVYPPRLPLDEKDREGLLVAIGASVLDISFSGVTNYSSTAYTIAAKAMELPEVRARIVPCTPVATVDWACAEAFVASFGARAFRRPLTPTEVTEFARPGNEAAAALGDFYDGLEYSMAAILMAPSFIYRPELGVPSDPGPRRYTSDEMATRLAYFFWNSSPDDALRASARAGLLDTEEGLAVEVDRMLRSDRTRDGVRAFFTDMLELSQLDALQKDPTIFVHFNAEFGPSAREETLRVIENTIFEEHADYRSLFTTRVTFLDRRLAAVYDLPAPSLTGFARFEHPASSPRAGILSHASFLALHSHPANTSAVLRGKFVRQKLMCGSVPNPPPGLNTAIPPATELAVTMRDRVRVHFEVPTCRGCHQLMDPIGLAFENFDGLGRYRTTESVYDDDGVAIATKTIDASGSIDGMYYSDALELGQLLHDHPDVPNCLVRTMYRYGTGHIERLGETSTLRTLNESFASVNYDVLELMRLIATSDGFRYAADPEELP